MRADWEPKVGDIVEYVGHPTTLYNDYIGGVGVVTEVHESTSHSPQMLINWISPPNGHKENITTDGLWAGNCKKLTEVAQ
jgi:hypothetical protein